MSGLYDKSGYRIKYGVFKEKVDPPNQLTFSEYMDATTEERQALRKEASKDLVNIDAVSG